MVKLFILLLLLPCLAPAHPGIGIVKDSKGNIYYTDLQRVWKIFNGEKRVVVPDVHTHELYIDQHDNLYGKGGYYDDRNEKFYHFQWVYRPGGKLDTVVGMKEEYVEADFALARDKKGNEYYLKRFLRPFTDTTHIYKKAPGGQEGVFATGNFKLVNWLHPQDDGSLLFASTDTIYRADPAGNLRIVASRLTSKKKGFNPKSGLTVWGIWQDNAHNVYAAVFSDQTVKKIEPGGKVSTVFTSQKNWTPLHGVFDNENKLWVLENSEKNEVRVTLVDTGSAASNDTGISWRAFTIPVLLAVGVALFFVKWRPAYHASKDTGKP